MSILHYLSEEVFLRIQDLLIGNSVYPNFKFLEKSQYWSKEELKQFQEEKLRALVEHSYQTVPYYHDLFNRLKLKPKDIKTKEDLIKIPILTKEIIKREGTLRFTSSKYPSSKRINSSSSGSTGEPLFYYTTRDAYSLNIAANLRGWYWMGFRLGDRYVKLSQNSRKTTIKILQDFFSNNLYLSTNPLIEENYDKILSKIERFKPKIIRCYPDPLLLIARYKKKCKSYKFSPIAINTTGNTLYPETRKEIEDAFSCKIYDAYSCEGNPTVFECPTHECYHSAEENGITEIIDDAGNLINNGYGRLISTDLHNLAHPFIRYDTQDLVEVNSTPCSCGRNLLRIDRILGRDNDIIQGSNGQMFIVHNFTGFFQIDHPKIKKSVDQFQVVKTKDNYIIFNLVVNNKYDIEVKEFIESYWSEQLKYPVVVKVVNEIPLTNSGKRKFIINE